MRFSNVSRRKRIIASSLERHVTSALNRSLTGDLLICVLSISYVVVRNLRGISVPEEPGMFNFSYIWNAAFSPSQSWERYSFANQASLIIWAPVSFIFHWVGISAVEHYLAIYLVRVIAILLLLRRFLLRFSNQMASLLGAIVCFTATPIRIAPLYTHWWSHVVLVLGILLITTEEPKTSLKKCAIQYVILVISTLAIWSNLPHLVSAWIALPIAVLIGRRLNLQDRMVIQRAFVLIVIGVILYVIPLVIFLKGISGLSEIAATRVDAFANSGPWLTAQGFGGWWYFDEACFAYICEKQEPLHFALTTFPRQVARGLIIGAAAVNCTAWFITRSRSKGAVSRDMDLPPIPFFVVLTTFALAVVGHYAIYWKLWEQLPSTLQIFREPYPKFSPMFYIMFSAWCVFWLDGRSQRNGYLPKLMLAVLAIYLVAPIYFVPKRPVLQPSLSDWAQIEASGKLLGKLPPQSCVLDISMNRNLSAFYQASYPQVHSRLDHLRPTWVNDGLHKLGRNADGQEQCLTKSRKPFGVIVADGDLSLLKSSKIHLGEIHGGTLPGTCLSDHERFVRIYRRHCITAIEVKTMTTQDNQIFIDWNLGSVGISSFFHVHPTEISSIYIESFDNYAPPRSVSLRCAIQHGQSIEYSKTYKANGGVLFDNVDRSLDVCDELQILVR